MRSVATDHLDRARELTAELLPLLDKAALAVAHDDEVRTTLRRDAEHAWRRVRGAEGGEGPSLTLDQVTAWVDGARLVELRQVVYRALDRAQTAAGVNPRTLADLREIRDAADAALATAERQRRTA